VLLSIVAALIQQMQVAALGLSHNALYHVVQAIGLLLIFITARTLFKPSYTRETQVQVSRETSPL
jgi:hypothetical protein